MLTKLTQPFLAAIITVGLFLLMNYLITPTFKPPTTAEPTSTIQLSREKRDESSKEKVSSRPKPPVSVKSPPPKIKQQSRPNAKPDKSGFQLDFPQVNTGDGFSTTTLDRRATALVQIPPQYPQGPLTRGIEGWVLLEFTISTTGTVQDIIVIDETPPNTFQRAAIRALKRWKYQPKIQNGKAVYQHKMREIFRFELEKNKS